MPVPGLDGDVVNLVLSFIPIADGIKQQQQQNKDKPQPTLTALTLKGYEFVLKPNMSGHGIGP